MVSDFAAKRARIIGVGSPFGDDAAGLEVVRRLAARPPQNVDLVEADRPGADIVHLVEEADDVLIVDAVRSGAPPGTLHELSLDEVAARGVRLASSHALGVAEALALARELGRAPLRVRVLGIEAAGISSEGAIAEAVRVAIDRAASRAREWASHLPRGGG